MLLAFQGGDVRAELNGSTLYLRARDLLAILNMVELHKEGSSASATIKSVIQRTGITLRKDIECASYTRAPLYIALSDVTTFLDNIHVITRDNTIQLMLEVIRHFKKQLIGYI